jgi:hypothetical protein
MIYYMETSGNSKKKEVLQDIRQLPLQQKKKCVDYI